MKASFSPFINENTHSLFLGTLPGERSLSEQRYYAHPQNKFWKLFYDVFEAELNSEYEDRVRYLQTKGFGLWDVVRQAHREGSLDSAIKNREINDFETLLKQYPNVGTFYFTSQQAYQWFFKVYKDSLPVRLVVLASPSPANARLRYEEKLADWKVKINP
ncbi:DNA-deoxyinosine glycosylase [Myroides ceti]|uniref:DNA-deoxyinosine glycosylase n=1 Tax=Paenimyroides ceti TaxID=395087 RepID=A0ABT8CR25_9FLAO|nr:DNA-deoxyinosine glycosylase [Paenimyroides ceti]MDN3706047.1 DNA-deoxyinosine glycosylase [Paenimyroides ceti]